MVIPVSVCGVVWLVTIIIIRDNRLLSLQVIKPSRCESQEKNINLSSVLCWQTGEIVPIVLGKMLLERKLCYNDPENFFTHSSLKVFKKFFKRNKKKEKSNNSLENSYLTRTNKNLRKIYNWLEIKEKKKVTIQ